MTQVLDKEAIKEYYGEILTVFFDCGPALAAGSEEHAGGACC